MEAKRRIHKFKFDEPTMLSGDATHVALVDKAANMTEVLVMKSKHMTQTTTTTEYDDETGAETYAEDSTSVHDYGGENVRVVNRKVRVTEQYVKVRNGSTS